MYADYKKYEAERLPHDVAIRLGCLEIKRFFKNLQQNALDKKSNMEYLEKELGLQRFIPKSVLNAIKVSVKHRQDPCLTPDVIAHASPLPQYMNVDV